MFENTMNMTDYICRNSIILEYLWNLGETRRRAGWKSEHLLIQFNTFATELFEGKNKTKCIWSNYSELRNNTKVIL